MGFKSHAAWTSWNWFPEAQAQGSRQVRKAEKGAHWYTRFNWVHVHGAPDTDACVRQRHDKTYSTTPFKLLRQRKRSPLASNKTVNLWKASRAGNARQRRLRTLQHDTHKTASSPTSQGSPDRGCISLRCHSYKSMSGSGTSIAVRRWVFRRCTSTQGTPMFFF